MPLFSTRGRNTLSKKEGASETTNNYVAYDDPDKRDDIRKGFDIGSVWINNDTETSFICVDNSKRNAVWKITSHYIDYSVAAENSTWSSQLIKTSTTDLEQRVFFLEQVIKDLTGLSLQG